MRCEPQKLRALSSAHLGSDTQDESLSPPTAVRDALPLTAVLFLVKSRTAPELQRHGARTFFNPTRSSVLAREGVPFRYCRARAGTESSHRICRTRWELFLKWGEGGKAHKRCGMQRARRRAACDARKPVSP